MTMLMSMMMMTARMMLPNNDEEHVRTMLMTVTGMLLTMFTYFVVSSLTTTGTYVRTYVHPILLGAESWLEAVSRVFLKILKKLSFAERYPSGAHDLGWKPELLFCCRVYPRVGESESCTYIRTYYSWLEAGTYVRFGI